MELFFILVSGAALIWLLARLFGSSASGPPPQVDEPRRTTTPQVRPQRQVAVPPPSPAMAAFKANEEWISQRWAAALVAKDQGGQGKTFPAWYFDPITERQIARLEDDGYRLDLSRLTKGQASDLIGLLTPPRPEDEEVLAFFKCPAHWMNETRGKPEAARLLAEPNSLSAWKARPSRTWQRELLKSYGVTMPKGIDFEAANALIESTEKELAAANPELLQRTQAINWIIEELSDAETRATYGYKKPPLTLIRQAIRELEDAGQTLDDMSSNIYSVVEKILELRPDLEKLG